ncbi:MAG: KH domain-containing protein [Thermomicrobiales bacterium]
MGDPELMRDDADAGFDEDGGDEDDWSDEPAVSSEAAEQLRALVVYLARNLVDDPETVVVDSQQRGGSVFLTLRVPEAELGKVIGRQGRIARALRTSLMIAGSRQHVRASLDIEG